MPNELFILPITSLFCNCKTPCTLLPYLSSDLHYACWIVETPRSRFMLHVFSCEEYSKAEVFFPLIVSLTSSMVYNGAGD